MNTRKKLLESSCLYVITDRVIPEADLTINIIKDAISGGADIIQLRDKYLEVRQFLKIASKVRLLTKRTQALFIINDRTDLALACDADGVHLGQGDLPVDIARQILGSRKIIGVSTHSLRQALSAQRYGADYIGVGPVFATPTKPDYPPVGIDLIGKVKTEIKIPFFAIGGIDINNIDKVISAGAERIAVVRAVVGAKDAQKAARQLKNKLNMMEV